MSYLLDEINGFKLIPLNAQTKKDLLREFGSKFQGTGAFDNLLNYVMYKRKGKTVLIEEKYIDKDFRSEFSGLYSKTFKKFDSTCTRLHFFESNINKINDIKNITDIDKESYLGFTVVRPIDVGKVGRTIIKPWIQDINRSYPLCKCDTSIHLFGIDFRTCGSPFIQQDTMVMTCAQASIWMAARYMHLKFGFKEYLPFEINEEASRFFRLQRTLPSEGLMFYSMFNALDNMGYSPICFTKDDGEDGKWNPVESIYKYIESCIPVIATSPDHAFVIIGHTFSPKRKFKIKQDPNDLNIVSSHNWVDAFIIHDDQLGPYRLLPVSKKDKNQLIKNGFGEFLPPPDWSYGTVDDIDGILVPLPAKAYILGEHLDDIINNLFDPKNLFIPKLVEVAEKEKVAPLMIDFLNSLFFDKNNPIVLRSYLSYSTEYKKNLKNELLATEMNEVVVEEYIKLPMPKYIWIIEIANAKTFSMDEQKNRKIFGEVIIDATANKFSLSFLAFHLPGALFLHDIDNNKIKVLSIADDKEYRHVTR
ncbi:MAG: hypothetical protein HZA77_02055 [Candidatus Schekmanbacteria bacterium]|nr:hypothetical protein [Candidatus Schekmanbacteria bacterium]